MKTVHKFIWKLLEYFVGNFQSPLPGGNVYSEIIGRKS
jgi:hypothetical protein